MLRGQCWQPAQKKMSFGTFFKNASSPSSLQDGNPGRSLGHCGCKEALWATTRRPLPHAAPQNTRAKGRWWHHIRPYWPETNSSVAKHVLIPFLCFHTFLWSRFLYLLSISQPQKRHWNQQLQQEAAVPLYSLGTAEKPLASHSQEPQLGPLPRRSHNTSTSPSPQLWVPGSDMDTRRCYLETLIEITTSVPTAALKTSHPST